MLLNLTILPGDGIGPEVTEQAVLVLQSVADAFDHNPGHLRPEAGLLRLRRELGAYANLRPAVFFPALEDCSPLRPEVVRGTDIMIVRELLGGAYFGQPRAIEGNPGSRVAINTMRYGEMEIERIARVAFELALKR